MTVCAKCQGRLHVRIAMGRWERCPDCFRNASSVAFIKSDIRGTETAVRPEIEALPPLPLRDVSVVHPDPMYFRQWVWRTLLDYNTTGIVYDYLDGFRLVDASFQRDTLYQSLRELQELPLLIVDFSTTRLDHTYLGPVFMQVLTVRQRLGRPTWCYTNDMALVTRFYGAETAAHVRAVLVGGQPILPALPPPTTEPNGGEQPTTAAIGKQQRRFDPNSV